MKINQYHLFMALQAWPAQSWTLVAQYSLYKAWLSSQTLNMVSDFIFVVHNPGIDLLCLYQPSQRCWWHYVHVVSFREGPVWCRALWPFHLRWCRLSPRRPVAAGWDAGDCMSLNYGRIIDGQRNHLNKWPAVHRQLLEQTVCAGTGTEYRLPSVISIHINLS